MNQRFAWTVFDVRSMLPSGWQSEIQDVARTYGSKHTLISQHSTSRESRSDFELPTGSLGGLALRERLPWLRSLYENEFRVLADQVVRESTAIMSDPRFGVVLNIQSDGDRYENHVDTNPLEGLLYCSSHPEGDGGELVISNRGDVHSIEEVDADASVIYPVAGHLVFFDARFNSHYVRPLRDASHTRIVAAMNYYTPQFPEEVVRPSDLNRHLTGHD